MGLAGRRPSSERWREVNFPGIARVTQWVAWQRVSNWFCREMLHAALAWVGRSQVVVKGMVE